MSSFTDAQIVAFVDGEAPAELAAQIRQAMAQDAQLAERVQAMQASHAFLEDGFAGQLDEPVPARLLAVLDDGEAKRRAPARRSARRLRLALAASVVAAAIAIGVTVNQGPRRGQAPPAPQVIQTALEWQPSGVPMPGVIESGRVEIMPTATWVTQRGDYCRSFEIDHLGADGPARTGLACREAGVWRLTRAPETRPVTVGPGDDRYLPAGQDLPVELRDGRQLDSQDERRLIESRWAARE